MRMISRNSVVFLMAFMAYSSLTVAKKSFIETSGDILELGLPITAGLISVSNHDTSGFVQLSETVVASSAATWGLKFAVNRTRPNGGKHSFPSGHTSLSFASATYLQKRYGSAYGIPAYALAAYVGYSRIQSKKHWTSDVLVGAGIGVASGMLLTKRFDNGVSLAPYASADGGGMLLSKSINF